MALLTTAGTCDYCNLVRATMPSVPHGHGPLIKGTMPIYDPPNQHFLPRPFRGIKTPYTAGGNNQFIIDSNPKLQRVILRILP